MGIFKLGDDEYEIEVLSERAERLAGYLQGVEIRLRETNNMIAILNKAKLAYITELKAEMLSAKSGLDFGAD